jgi:hypothetical protein
MDLDRLISLVQENQNLYDTQRADYLDRDKRDNTWTKIGVQMNLSSK